jgi:pimeloyl-ACP methyl ester carboxylesterase
MTGGTSASIRLHHAMTKYFCLGLAGFALLTGCQTRPVSPPAVQSRSHTYVLVHGAWGGGWDWKTVDQLLAADGNKVYRPTLTGQGEHSHLASTNIDLATHIQDIVNVILWEDLHDVVLVGHSYGGMVITGVADRVPGRIKQLIYLDALLPENDECVMEIGSKRIHKVVQNGFILAPWVKAGTPPPHDVPMSAQTFTQPLTLTNQAAARKLPAAYILTVDKGDQPKDDDFYPFYLRAGARGWPTSIMEGDHNVQRTHPQELARRLEAAPKD